MVTSFLARSNAGWLLFVSDGAFVNASAVFSLISQIGCTSPDTIPKITGQCSEVRDYFQVFAKNSGGLLSRKAAQLLNETAGTWDVACEVEIDGNEALSHALDIHGLYALWNHNQRFLGSPFVLESDYTALLEGDFRTVRKCPQSYGYTRVCFMTFQPLANPVFWAGGAV
jgi:hypothetical protein